MAKVQVAIEEVKALKARLREINKLDFENIEWTENGVPLVIDKRCVEGWEEIGLNNSDFISNNFYINTYGK